MMAATTAASSFLHAQQEDDEGQQFFLRLLKANDESVRRLPPSGRGRLGRGDNIASLMTAYCTPESAHHRSPDLIPLLERAAQSFVDAQNPSGLLDAGNLDSPPDTAFTIDALACALHVARQSGPNDSRLTQVKETLTRFLRSVGDALVTGGIHTPNHRWVVCSALARINALFPARKYVDRIDDWLGEGIYQDSDGLFPERSPNYARVEVASFLTMARLLNRPALLDPVRRHLTANLYLLHPDGEIETVNSRRQDQDRPVHVANFYVQYRYMAIRDNNPAYAAVARLIAARSGEGLVEGVNPVIQFLEEPLLRRSLPASAGGDVPKNYVRVFANSKLVRIRRDARSASIYGGGDKPLVIASGTAHNPTFFNFRNGRAILDSVRMGSPQFFSLGTFRPESVKIENNGTVVHLHHRFEAPYYQPLPREHRRADGDYPLTPAKDGRFWSKLDFPHRRQSSVQVLDQKVTILEKSDGSFELQIEITGHDKVPYTVELAFRPGGEFAGSGLQTVDQAQFLKEGKAVYRNGPDAIEFGPGQADHQATNISGHLYQAHNGALRAAGTRVYITGFTPFRKVLTIRAV